MYYFTDNNNYDKNLNIIWLSGSLVDEENNDPINSANV